MSLNIILYDFLGGWSPVMAKVKKFEIKEKRIKKKIVYNNKSNT